jgi:hypothetical protein
MSFSGWACMERVVQREKLAMLGSGILFGLAIISLPDQFLFSKTLPSSFWKEYFPSPFGAGWFITFIVLLPVLWISKSVFIAIKGSVSSLSLSALVAVPISLLIIGETVSPNNLLNQYLWVGIIFFPPLIIQIVLRWCACFYVEKLLTKRR